MKLYIILLVLFIAIMLFGSFSHYEWVQYVGAIGTSLMVLYPFIYVIIKERKKII